MLDVLINTVPKAGPSLSASSDDGPDVDRFPGRITAPALSATSDAADVVVVEDGADAPVASQEPAQATTKPAATDSPATPVPSLDKALARLQPPAPPTMLQVGDPPVRAHYSDPQSFDEALIRHGTAQGLNRANVEKHQAQLAAHNAAVEDAVRQNYNAKKAAFVAQHPDFDAVAHADNLSVTQIMAETIVQADNAPEIGYYLGKNPAEAGRIAAMTPIKQVAEIGRIAERLANPVAAKKPTPRARAATPTARPSQELSMTAYAEQRLAALRAGGSKWR